MELRLPNIIERTIPSLRKLVGDVDKVALINVLNAKLANMITQTGVNFRQYSNSKPAVLSYYGINFMNSGTSKDYSVDCVNNYLIPFVEEVLRERIEQYKEEYYELKMLDAKTPSEKKKIEKEVDNIRVANYELHNPNCTGLYKEAEQIAKIKFGSLFIRIGEFGDYLDSIVGNNNPSKKELYQKLKEIYEGTIAPSIIAGDGKREVLKNIPVQVLIYTDFENLYDERIKKYYVASMKTGQARRCFTYMPLDKNRKIGYPVHPETKNEAIFELLALQKEYRAIFDTLNELRDKTFYLSGDAQEYLYQYNCRCIDYFNESKDDIIIRLEKKESFWKITKLAVIYGILENPSCTVIKKEHVQMAESFYRLIEPSLKTVLNEREKTVVEKFAEFIFNKCVENGHVMRTDLRKTNWIKKNFAKEFEKMLPEIEDELKEVYKCYLFEYEGKGNTKGLQIRLMEE